MKRDLFALSVALCVLALAVFLFSACNFNDQDSGNAEYSVTFIADGEIVAVETFTEGEDLIEPAVPAKTGYTGSWQTFTADGGDKVVYAVYVPVEYVATFIADGVTVGALTFTVEDDSVEEPEVPKKAGYVARWEEYTLTAADITVNAVYIPGEYTVTFIADGNVVSVVPYKTGDERVDAPAVPQKVNCVGRWEEYVLSGDLTVYAIYENALRFSLATDCASYEVKGCVDGVTEVVVPESYEGLPVTAVSDGAFKDCAGLETVKLPDTIENIGNSAFEGCRSLKQINISAVAKTVGVKAFYGCTSLKEIYLCGVFYLEDQAFFGCRSLEKVDFGAELIFIGTEAFADCVELSEAVLPDSTTVISEGAFRGCVSLESLRLPASLVAVSAESFKDCISLAFADIPAGVEGIGAYAFAGCASMSELRIFGNVSEWGEYAFSDCGKLSEIYFAGNSRSELSADTYVFFGAGSESDGIKLTIASEGELPTALFCDYPDGKTAKVTQICYEEGKTSLTADSNVFPFLNAVHIPESVSEIEKGALDGYMSAAESENGILYLDGWAAGCDDHGEEASLMSGTRGIVNGAFEKCVDIISAYIPASVTSIGGEAFSGCSGLKELYVFGENTKVGARAFYDCVSLSDIYWDVASATDSEPDAEIFCNVGILTDGVVLVFGNNVERVPSYFFCENNSLAGVFMSDNVTVIGDNAFRECVNLTNVVISENILSIGRNAFDGCDQISGAMMPADAISYIGKKSLTEIVITGKGSLPDEAFYQCENLLYAELCDNVTSVGARCFYGCENLVGFQANGIAEIGSNAFAGCGNLLYVSATLPVFRQIPLTNLQEITVCGGGTINKGMFAGCKDLYSVAIAGDIYEIGANAFYGCNALASVVFEDKDGWSVSDTGLNVSIEVSSEELSDSEYAAGLLTGVYCGSTWIKT